MNLPTSVRAYVLIITKLGQESLVVEELDNVPTIKRVHSLYGVYDVIAEVEAETMDKVKDVVFNKIRQLKNVKSTTSLITYGEPVINN